MNLPLQKSKRILIIGESGRGKSTLAQKISERLKLPTYSTDDFFWKTKFTEMESRDESVRKIKEIYTKDEWVVEGSSNHLIVPGFESADIILRLGFNSVFSQWWALIKRNLLRKSESFRDLIKFLWYVTKKRYGVGNAKMRILEEALKPYEAKIVNLKSYREINNFIDLNRISHNT